MAKYVGKGGLVSAGVNNIGNLMSWTLVETAAPISQKSLGDEYDSHSTTDADHPKTWNGSATAQFDEADTAQAALTPGASISITFEPRGDTSSFPNRTGTCTVTEVSESAEVDGNIEVEFTFQGNGALTRGTVV